MSVEQVESSRPPPRVNRLSTTASAIRRRRVDTNVCEVPGMRELAPAGPAKCDGVTGFAVGKPGSRRLQSHFSELTGPDRTSRLSAALVLSVNANRTQPVYMYCAPGEPLTTSAREVAAALGEAIAQRIGEPRYNLWFAKNTKFSWTDDQMVVGVPNLFFQEWLQKSFADAVSAAATGVLGRPMQIRFAIDPDLCQAARQAQAAGESPRIEDRGSGIEDRGSKGKPQVKTAPAKGGPPSAIPDPPSSIPDPRSPKRARHWHRLSEFVVGACN